jgi:hypothetical protein
MRNAAVFAFGAALPAYIINTGLLTDELSWNGLVYRNPSAFTVSLFKTLDERVLPEEFSYGTVSTNASDKSYEQLQGVRTAVIQAIGQLAVSDTTPKDTSLLSRAANRALRSELYALYGYTELMLADLFCSGVPLSTLDFHGDFTYRAGAPTDAIYREAIAKFDTAITLSGDSARILDLARVGLGRAYLAAGNSAAAATAVAGVPSTYRYQVMEWWDLQNPDLNRLNSAATAADHEGINGLAYVTAGDPRTTSIPIKKTVIVNGVTGSSLDSVTYRLPAVIANGPTATGYTPITVASGIEAQLIQAEAALQTGDVATWLSMLNQLRAHAAIPGTTQPDSAALPQLGDPGATLSGASADSARIALMFSERAAWLYMTGHRQGDLRRQLRQYGRYWYGDQSNVYPSGIYPDGIGNRYGISVTAPIPPREYLNPLFHGCLNRAP